MSEIVGGKTELQTLLRNLKPVRCPGVFVYCSLPGRSIPVGLNPLAVIQEDEGLTLVLDGGEARKHGLTGIFPCTCITLRVHSDLAAVGLTAAVSSALAAENIACNVIAGYHHDHLFVPVGDADRAMEILTTLSHSQSQP